MGFDYTLTTYNFKQHIEFQTTTYIFTPLAIYFVFLF